MTKKKTMVAKDGLTKAAVAVGAALGNLAQKVGLGGTAMAPKVAKKAVKKTVAKSPKQQAVAKKAAEKRTSPKKSPAKKK